MAKVVLIFILIFGYSNQQNVDVVKITSDLQTATNFTVFKQNKVLTTILGCKASASMASNNLKASNFSKNLTNSLDDLANFTLKLLTIQDFEALAGCQNISACECISFRMVLLYTEIRKIGKVSENINSNSSKFYELFSSLTRNYALNFRSIQSIWTKEIAVIKTCSQCRLVLSELSDMNRILNWIKNYFIDVNSYLDSQLSLCPVSTSTLADEGNKIDDQIKNCQQQVLNLTSIALDKVNISLNTVASTKKVQAGLVDSKAALKSLFEALARQKAGDDYDSPTLTWPRVPDTSGASGTYMKVRTCQAKKESYSFSKYAAQRNQDEIQEDLDEFKSSSGITTSSRTKRSTQAQDVITATANLIGSLNVYVQQLNTSIVKVESMAQNFTQQIKSQTCPTPTLENLGPIGPAAYPCTRTFDVFDNFGCYRKTLCQITSNVTSNNASILCSQRKANPFGVLSIHDYGTLNYALATIYGLVSTNRLHIGGRQLANGTWMHGTQKIFNWAVNLPSIYSATDYCLQAYKNGSQVYYLPTTCSSVINSQVCELVRPYTPISIPITTSCNFMGVINGPNGYVKTACLAHYSSDRALAHGFCQGNGMRLYSIVNSYDWTQLKNLTNYAYGSNAQTLHVSGERQMDGTYSVDQPSPAQLYPAVRPNTSKPCLIYQTNLPILITDVCTTIRYVVCEFYRPPLPPTTKAVPSNCLNPIDFFDSSGNYQKTFCRLGTSLNFSATDSICRAQKMYPLGINTAEDVARTNAYVNSIYGSNGQAVHIGGLMDANGTWFTYTPDKKPLYTGINITGTGINLQFNYNAATYPWFTVNAGNVLAPMLCEFNRMGP